jgi:hypothetical protein
MPPNWCLAQQTGRQINRQADSAGTALCVHAHFITRCGNTLVLTVHSWTLHKCTRSCHRSSAVVDDVILQEDFITTALHVQQDLMHLCRVQLHCA